MRRAALIAAAVVVAAAVALPVAFRRVPAGTAAWNAGTGTLLVAGASSAFVARWGWQPIGGGPLSCAIAATSREGARVTVRLAVSLPPGHHALSAAETPGAGLTRVAEGEVKQRLGALSLACLAGLGQDCPPSPEGAVASAVAQRLGVGVGSVEVTLLPDPAAVTASRLAALKTLVGRPQRRVLVVGWDGADWEVLEPLARRGVMPNLARLMASGSWGELQSITPLLSPLIWTTMATGVGPEEHGVLDFVEIDPGTGAKVPVSGRSRRVPALWNIATAAGLSVVASGWWASWPAEAVNGVMISDRLFFLLSDTVGDAPAGTVVFPPEREGEFRALAERAEAETDEATVRALLPVSSEAYRAAIAAKKGMADPIDGFRRIMVGTRTYFGSALEASAGRPDLEMVYCIGTDEIGHVLSPYVPPPLPGADPGFSEAARVGVERYFAVVDRWLGRLIEGCPLSECAVLVVSDHGFKWGADRPRDFSGVAAATAALWHRPRGIFVLAGRGVAGRGRVATPPSVFDVAPTVAALLGLPPGEGWRGTPLPGAPALRPQTVPWARLVPPESYRPQVGSVAPSPEYVAQLKALGYLEGGEGTGAGTQATEGELNNLGLVQLEAKRYAEAEKAFRDAIARNPSYASPHYNLRRAYFETGRYDEADGELWRAVALGLRDAPGAVARAAADYEAAGSPERAAALLGEACRRFPDDARFVVRRLELLIRLKRCPEAAAAGSEAAGRFAGDPAVQAFYGIAAACSGDLAAARRSLERSLQLKPDQPEIRQILESLPPAP